MAYLLMTSLLVLRLLDGTEGGKAIDLGLYCGQEDYCVNPQLRLVCDRATETCRLAEGEACGMVSDALGTKDMCVSGAVCEISTGATAGSCVCKGLIYLSDGAGFCSAEMNKYGGPCNDMDTCLDTGLTCNYKKFCTCQQNRVPVLTDGSCKSSQVFCQMPQNCFDSPSNYNCIGNTCVCAFGKSGEFGQDNCVKGKACVSNTSDCGNPEETHLECVDGFCDCQCGYHGIQGDICYVAAGEVGGGCYAQTPGTQGTCSEDRVCVTSVNNTQIMICAQVNGSVSLVTSALCVVIATFVGWLSTGL